MKVSVVTISFNQADFIERTIKSVLDQKNDAEIEYIVLDAGSTDGSRDIIKKYEDKIDRIVFESDRGPSDGLNKGFAMASGEIFAFLNSDDILYPGSIRAALDFLSASPSVDVVSGHAYIIDKDDSILRKSYSQKMNLLQYAYGACIINQPSTFFRREIFLNTNGFELDNRSNWDGELFVDMAQAGACFAICNGFWSGYRLHSVSITASAKLDNAMRSYHDKMFRKIMHRERNQFDKVASLFFRGIRFLNNPAALWERITKGKIYGRALS